MVNSIDCKGCHGCKHRRNISKQWCYMFDKKPNTLPCGQHDKFKLYRKITGNLIYKFVKSNKK